MLEDAASGVVVDLVVSGDHQPLRAEPPHLVVRTFPDEDEIDALVSSSRFFIAHP